MQDDERDKQWGYITPSHLPTSYEDPNFHDVQPSTVPDIPLGSVPDIERMRRRQLQENVVIEEDAQGSRNLMGLGTIFVIGAVSANVFTFQRSRWAVGKEIHRAWQKRQAYNNTRSRAASSSSTSSAGFRTTTTASGSTTGFAQAAREAAAKAAQAAARAAAQQAYRAASEAAAQAARQQQKNARMGEARWETWGSSGPSGGTWHRSGRMAFDASDIDELLRAMRGERKPGNSQRNGNPSNVDEMLDELFRSMNSGAAGGTRNRSAGGAMNMDAMFEEMMRAARQASERSASGARGGAGDQRIWEEFMGGGRNPFGTGNPFGDKSGVYTRGNFDNSRHYQTLGLEPGADMEAVKRAYRKLVMAWHPDRYRGNDKEEASRRFREITQAYEALTKMDD